MNKKKGIRWKKYQNDTLTRQRRDSVTVSDVIARKINTMLLLPIHWARRRAAAASVIVSDPLDTSSILIRRLRCCCCSLPAHLSLTTPLSSSYITWANRQTLTASVVVSDTLDTSFNPCPLATPPSSSPSLQARINLLTPPLLLSIPWYRKHTAASSIRDVHLDALSLLLPPLTPQLLSSIPRTHLPLPTPPSLSPIIQARNRNSAASVVVPEYSPPPSSSPIPRTRRLFFVLRR